MDNNINNTLQGEAFITPLTEAPADTAPSNVTPTTEEPQTELTAVA